MQRTHRARVDRRWMPRRVRRTRGLYSVGSTLAFVGAAAAATLAAPFLLVAWKGVALGGIGAYLTGDTLGRRRFDKQVRAMAQGEIPLVGLAEQENGTLVVVQGTIEAEHTLRGVLHNAPGVYRRMKFGSWIHEAAVDFVLVSDTGERVPVQAAGARWLTELREPLDYPKQSFVREDVAGEVQDLIERMSGASISASEQVLPTGTKVQIVGYKGVKADPEGRFVGYRSAPERAVIQSGVDLPLVISVHATYNS